MHRRKGLVSVLRGMQARRGLGSGATSERGGGCNTIKPNVILLVSVKLWESCCVFVPTHVWVALMRA